MNSLIVTIALVFLASGIGYGIGAKTMSTSIDVINAVQKSIASLSGLIFLLLIISQFLAYFNYTNMAPLAAISLGQHPAGGQPRCRVADDRFRDRGD